MKMKCISKYMWEQRTRPAPLLPHVFTSFGTHEGMCFSKDDHRHDTQEKPPLA